MQKLITFIIPVNNAQESDLVIPLSSINNQIGLDFDQVEVLLIDNGAYKLNDLKRLTVLANLDLRYVQTPQRQSWQAAFQLGIERASGQFVMLLAPNAQLGGPSVLQTLLYTARSKPEADLLTGMVLDQEVRADRQSEYKVAQNQLSSRGLMISRKLLTENRLNFNGAGEYADEMFARLAHQLATQELQLNVVTYVRFVNRAVPTAVLKPVAPGINADWLQMMGDYFRQLQERNQAAYFTEFARFVVRCYSLLDRLPVEQNPALLTLLGVLVSQNQTALPFARKFVTDLMHRDHSERAPWVANPEHFHQYLQLMQIAQS